MLGGIKAEINKHCVNLLAFSRRNSFGDSVDISEDY